MPMGLLPGGSAASHVPHSRLAPQREGAERSLALRDEEMLLYTLSASFLSTRETSILLLVWGRATPFQPSPGPPNCRLLWVGYWGAGVHSLMLYCPRVPDWLPERGGVPPLQLLAPARAPECLCQHLPPAVGTHAAEKKGEVRAGEGRKQSLPF